MMVNKSKMAEMDFGAHVVVTAIVVMPEIESNPVLKQVIEEKMDLKLEEIKAGLVKTVSSIPPWE